MSYAHIESVKEQNQESLEAITNVNGVGLGVKWVNGIPTKIGRAHV